MNPEALLRSLDEFLNLYFHYCRLPDTERGQFQRDAAAGIILSILAKSKEIIPQEALRNAEKKEARAFLVDVFGTTSDRQKFYQNVHETIIEFSDHLIRNTPVLASDQLANLRGIVQGWRESSRLSREAGSNPQ